MELEQQKYHGNVEIIGGALLRGWCCARSGETCEVTIIVNGKVCARIHAIIPRNDLKKRGFCTDGGGFELDISSFLDFGSNRVIVTDPSGKVLPNGEHEINFRDVIRADMDPWFQDQNHIIGVHGNTYLATDPLVGSVLGKMWHIFGYKYSKGDSGQETCNLWFSHPHLQKPNNLEKFINVNCNDISKSGIDIAHRKVFKRGICLCPNDIEPEKFYLVKSNENATHDGRIIKGSDITTEHFSNFVVQRLINNNFHTSSSQRSVYDIRVPIIGNVIPFVYIKVRRDNIRFSNANDSATITLPSNVLSQEEIENIIKFCSHIGLDYGELDVLRDQNDGDIWIVDANNTPSGPPNGLVQSDKIFAIRELALAFKQQFINPGLYWKNGLHKDRTKIQASHNEQVASEDVGLKNNSTQTSNEQLIL